MWRTLQTPRRGGKCPERTGGPWLPAGLIALLCWGLPLSAHASGVQLDPLLSLTLFQIYYAPFAVVGLLVLGIRALFRKLHRTLQVLTVIHLFIAVFNVPMLVTAVALGTPTAPWLLWLCGSVIAVPSALLTVLGLVYWRKDPQAVL